MVRVVPSVIDRGSLRWLRNSEVEKKTGQQERLDAGAHDLRAAARASSRESPLDGTYGHRPYLAG